jgi:hypothetical protein
VDSTLEGKTGLCDLVVPGCDSQGSSEEFSGNSMREQEIAFFRK